MAREQIRTRTVTRDVSAVPLRLIAGRTGNGRTSEMRSLTENGPSLLRDVGDGVEADVRPKALAWRMMRRIARAGLAGEVVAAEIW